MALKIVKKKWFLLTCLLCLVIIFFILKTKGPELTDRPNIVLIILDTVRADYTSLELKFKKDLTPNLKSLAGESTIFPNCWANAPWTVPSHASMFTGLLPSEHSCTTKQIYLDSRCTTIAEILSKSGYETAAFFSNPWLNNNATGLMRGFQVIEDIRVGGLGNLSLETGDQGGRQINRNIDEWLGKRLQKKPFFLFINYLEAHLPYDPQPEYREKYLKDLSQDNSISIRWAHEFNAGLHGAETVDWKKVRRLYGGDVFTADRLLGSLLETLKEHGEFDNSAIIVTSDHGENLGEHGLVEHQFSIHENLLLVPLVIRAPGILKRGINRQSVTLSDLFETIIELAGAENTVDVDTDTDTAFSRSLLPTKGKNKSGRYIVSEYAGAPYSLLQYFKKLNPQLDITPLALSYKSVTDGKWRFTISSDGKRMLYNLEKDPFQEQDYSSTFPGIAHKMEEYLKNIFSIIKQVSGKPIKELDEETKKRLRSLGYIR